MKKVVSNEIFGNRLFSRAKLPVMSLILFVFLIFSMFADSFVSNSSLQLSATVTKSEDSHQVLENPARKVKSNVVLIPLSVSTSTQRKIIKVDVEKQDSGVFKRKLSGYEILKSDDLAKKFHGRVLEFLNQKCGIQFFMTWISPAESFGRREILALESVFHSHPDSCLMILSRTLDSKQGYRILKPLLDQGFKVLAITPDFPFLVKNTPAESWLNDIKSGKRNPGQIPLAQNLSNLLRLVVLYKYGGVYLDTDFIVLKSFKGLKNTIGAQSIDGVSKTWTRLNNAVLIFDTNHPLLFKFIEDFALTFDGNKWGHNGPYMVSRVVRRVEGRVGYNFTILPPMAFYPVDWIKIGRFFRMPKDEVGLKWLETKLRQLNKQTYGVHLWNKQSSKLEVEEGSVMARLISEHCVLCNQI